MNEAEILAYVNDRCQDCRVKQALDLEMKRVDNELLDHKSSINELEQTVKNVAAWAIGIALSGVGYLLWYVFENVLVKKGG